MAFSRLGFPREAVLDVEERIGPCGHVRYDGHVVTEAEIVAELYKEFGVYCEVDPERLKARRGVAQNPFEREAAGYRTAPAFRDDREVEARRRIARRLDARLKQQAVEAASMDFAPVSEAADRDDDEVDASAPEIDSPATHYDEACDEMAQESGAFHPANVVLRTHSHPKSDADRCVDACLAAEAALVHALDLLERANDADDEGIQAFLEAVRAGDMDADDFLQDVEHRLAAEDEAQRLIERLNAVAALPVIRPPFPAIESPLMQSQVPVGHQLTTHGVYYVGDDEGKQVRITLTPLCIDALVRTAAGAAWAARVRALSLDGHPVEFLAPLESLQSGKGALQAELAALGVPVLNDQALRRYLLLSLANPNLPRLLGVTRMGFAMAPTLDGEPRLCFVLPDRTVYPDRVSAAEAVVMLPHSKLPVHRGYHARGELSDWQAMISVTRGNRLQTFVVALAIASPLLAYSGTENGGVHLYCVTSRGKTLALQLAVTVFGNGAPPQVGEGAPRLVQSWHGTANAIEAQTAAGSGTLVALDEVSVHRGPVPVFSQTGGQDKGRVKGDGSLHESQSWSALILSTGEEPMSQQIESKGGRPMKGGEAVRMLDVPVADLLLSGDATAVEALKRDCGRVYGTAGPAFVRWVLNRFDGEADALRDAVTAEVDRLRDQLCAEARACGYALHTHHVRAMRRLALVAVAGGWAVDAGVLPHTDEEVLDAVRAVRDAWLDGQSFVSEEARAIEKVRDYVTRYRAQMVVTTGGRERTVVPNNCRGILDQGRVLLTESIFREACGGLDPRLVAGALEGAGILRRNDDQYKAKVSIAELGIHKVRHYVLDYGRLFDGSEEGALQAGEPAAEADNEEAPTGLVMLGQD